MPPSNYANAPKSPTTSSKVSQQTMALDLTDHFLIAMPAMTDPNFAGTLIYVVEHGKKGAMGVVVNRPIELTMSDLFDRIDLKLTDQPIASQAVLLGGPVQNDRGFVLHRPAGQWSSSVRVNEQVALTSSKDVLESVAKGEGPLDVVVALGYAGWGAGQLEDEIAQNAWLTVQGDAKILFESPASERQHLAFDLLGIDPNLMSSNAGHA
jgi:putative transcriptional regulator